MWQISHWKIRSSEALHHGKPEIFRRQFCKRSLIFCVPNLVNGFNWKITMYNSNVVGQVSLIRLTWKTVFLFSFRNSFFLYIYIFELALFYTFDDLVVKKFDSREFALINNMLILCFFSFFFLFHPACSIKLELEKLAQEKTEMQRHYVMVSLYLYQFIDEREKKNKNFRIKAKNKRIYRRYIKTACETLITLARCERKYSQKRKTTKI